MNVDKLTFVILNLVSLIDRGQGNAITVAEAMDGAAHKSLWSLATRRVPALAWVSGNDPVITFLNEGWHRLHVSGPGAFAVSEQGICLIVAWTVDLIKLGEAQ